MPLAVMHVLTSAILVDLYRDYVTKHKKYFTLYTVFLAGFFGLLPDVDIALRIIANFFKLSIPSLLQHGNITHTPFFAVLFFIPGFILWKIKKKKQAVYFFVAVPVILIHVLLDYFFGGGSQYGIMWLFPFSTEAWKLNITSTVFLQEFQRGLDAVILLVWLWHEEIKHKISDFI